MPARTSHTRPRTVEAVLAHTENYIQTLTLRPIEAPAEHLELTITSRLLDARDPAARHVKHRCVVTEDALQHLRAELDALLGPPQPRKSF